MIKIIFIKETFSILMLLINLIKSKRRYYLLRNIISNYFDKSLKQN